MYFEGGVSSVYLWDLDAGFAGVILIKKAGDGSKKIKGKHHNICLYVDDSYWIFLSLSVLLQYPVNEIIHLPFHIDGKSKADEISGNANLFLVALIYKNKSCFWISFVPFAGNTYQIKLKTLLIILHQHRFFM